MYSCVCIFVHYIGITVLYCNNREQTTTTKEMTDDDGTHIRFNNPTG